LYWPLNALLEPVELETLPEQDRTNVAIALRYTERVQPETTRDKRPEERLRSVAELRTETPSQLLFSEGTT
jgi:hypothetical protein